MTSNLDKKLKVICSLVMLAALALMPITGAGDLQAQDSETLQRGPVNPDFLRFLEEPPEPFYGYIPPSMDLSHLDAIPVEAALKLTTLPGRFDWRDEGKVTSVKNQGPCGTCWAFCTLAGLESRVLIVEDVAYTAGDAAYDYSEQNLICCTDPAYVYLDGDRCNRGSWGLVAGDTLIKKGVRLEACQPYDTATINEEGCDDSCEPVKTVTGGRMIAFQAASPHVVGPIKTALRNHGPLITAYCHADGYLYAGSIYYWPDCTQTANHCALIVGWDDNIEWPDQSGTGAWIVKNSWGTRWGDDGYFYLCYGSGNMAGVGFADYKDYDPYEVLYYWDEAGMVTDVGYNTPSAWMANIFTSTQNGTLTHVDFYTTSNNAQYEIHVYLDGDISDGLQNLASSQAGTCQEFGYYSIQLDSAVPLSVGDAFAIEVKMTTPGYGRPVPVEVVLQGFVEPPIQSGVSYMRQGRADPWEDLAPSGYNACLRARVSVAQPGITANPGSFELTLFPDTTQEYTLSIGNTSDATLDYDITIQETIGRAGMVVGENLFLGEPASMALEAPLKRSPVEPQHTGQTQSGWQGIMTEDLEGTSPGDWGLWVTGGASDAYWAKCRCNPHTDSHSAFCAKSRTDGVNPPAHYPSNMDDWMFYGPFSLEDATAANLNLWVWLDTESDYDLLQCVASVDGQNFSGWSWSGNNADWESESFDLTDVPTLGNLCGQPEVWIAFIFTIDQPEAYPGVFVDDVVMRKYAEEVPAGFWLDVNPKSGSVAPGGSDSIAVTVNTTGLAPGDHHAEIVICGNDPDQNPKVVPVKLHVSNPDPSVTTQTASAIGSDLATLNLSYTLGAYSSVDVRFAYKKAGDPAWTATSWVSVLTPSGFLSEGGTHEETLIGLSSNTAYEFKAQLRYDETAIESSVLTFATEKTEPTVTTEDATGVTTNSADLNMSFTVGDYGPVEVRFNWREDGIGVWTESTWTPQESDGTHTEMPSGLNSNTVYEFKTQLKCGHSASVIEGDVLTFITKEKGGCFIATAAYGTPMAEEVQILREFRDGYLLTNRGGQALVAIYYRTSPPIAGLLDQHPTLKPIVRAGLVPAVTLSALVVNTTSADRAAATGLCMLVLVAAAVWARRRGRRPEYS